MSHEEKPFIGINTDYRVSSNGRFSCSQLHSGYFDCVTKAGGVPVLIPPIQKVPDLEMVLERIDGLLLTDGDDLDPKRMGMKPHMSCVVMQKRREDVDRVLCRLAEQRKLPLLAIGAGMQLLNVIFGGSLYQHLRDDLPRAMDHEGKYDGEDPHRHAIEVTPGSRLDEIYGPNDIRVNSRHHQAIRRVSPRFQATALAPDGVVEGIEAIDPDWFCIGVQWNPSATTGSALDLQLFEALVAACRGVLSLAAA